ncbi:sulfite exporter TauE/SafE family protein [Nocardia sp. NPDC050712]|uniref:sulfite exporter TauE/SafE family protein n=1 Tax=Nocardia sp. NPDC050712 TaxID=3155518 RepID=UPI00340E25E8
MDLAQLTLLLLAGVGAGLCNAVAGGGSLLSFPVLLALGLGPVPATVTNAVAVWPGYLGGAAALRKRAAEFRTLLPRLAGTAVAGALAGLVVLLAAPAAVFSAVVPFLVLGATALFAAQPWLSRRLTARQTDSPRTLYAGVFLAGLYGAYFNGGMGIVVLTALAFGLDASAASLNGLKSALTLVIATTSMIAVALFGPVHWLSVAVLAPACLLGGVLGAKLSDRLHPSVFRAVVVLFGTGAGIAMLLT